MKPVYLKKTNKHKWAKMQKFQGFDAAAVGMVSHTTAISTLVNAPHLKLTKTQERNKNML